MNFPWKWPLCLAALAIFIHPAEAKGLSTGINAFVLGRALACELEPDRLKRALFLQQHEIKRCNSGQKALFLLRWWENEVLDHYKKQLAGQGARNCQSARASFEEFERELLAPSKRCDP